MAEPGEINNRKRNHVPNEGEEAVAEDTPRKIVASIIARPETNRLERHRDMIKLTNDIVTEMRKIIFVFHSTVTEEKTRESIIREGKGLIGKLLIGPVKDLADELRNAPEYYYARTVTVDPGQFEQPKTLYSVMENRALVTFTQVCANTCFATNFEVGKEQKLAEAVPKLDYMLCLADLTGVVMKRCIDCITVGRVRERVYACQLLRNLYLGFLGLRPRGLTGANLNVAHEKILKAEKALYTFVVSGCETLPDRKVMSPLPPCTYQKRERLVTLFIH